MTPADNGVTPHSAPVPSEPGHLSIAHESERFGAQRYSAERVSVLSKTAAPYSDYPSNLFRASRPRTRVMSHALSMRSDRLGDVSPNTNQEMTRSPVGEGELGKTGLRATQALRQLSTPPRAADVPCVDS